MKNQIKTFPYRKLTSQIIFVKLQQKPIFANLTEIQWWNFLKNRLDFHIWIINELFS